jgi:hypothetical protein
MSRHSQPGEGIRAAAATAGREIGLVLAAWPLAFGAILIAVAALRGRADLRVVATVLLLGLLLSSLGAILFDVGGTLRRFVAPSRLALIVALTSDGGIFVGSLLVMALTPWNTLPALALAGVALLAAFAHLAPLAAQRQGWQWLAVTGAILFLALCGGAATAAASLVAVWRAGPDVISIELPKPSSPDTR